MCEPISIAVGAMAMSAASSVMNFKAQQDAASANNKYQSEMAERSRENALAANRNDQKQLTLRTIQEADSKSEQNRAGAIQAEQAAAAGRTSAAESGLSGLSLDNLVADIYRRSSNNESIRNINYDNTVNQLAAQREASGITAKSRMVMPQYTTGPSPMSLAVGLGKAAFSGYNSYQIAGGSWGQSTGLGPNGSSQGAF